MGLRKEAFPGRPSALDIFPLVEHNEDNLQNTIQVFQGSLLKFPWKTQQIRRKERKTMRHEKITELFGGWEETLIWSCLQGVMGEIHVSSAKDAAVAILGDFAFYAGNPDEELLRVPWENSESDFRIMVPQNDAWGALFAECYGDRAKKVLRYALKKEKGIFDRARLEQAAAKLPEGCRWRLIGEQEYDLCKSTGWARDFVSQFRTWERFQELGLGVVLFLDGELAAGASSYSRYREGIEIEIDTREDCRRRGLAYACGARLILECLDRGWYPSWDAQNLWSLALAEKLGYHFSHEYAAYEIREKDKNIPGGERFPGETEILNKK